MPRREGNDPKRRIVPRGKIEPAVLKRLAKRARYVGSARHKRIPADYGFHPPAAPAPHKSLCDRGGVVKRKEAAELLREGLMHGMISDMDAGDFPKFVWSVDSRGRVYEAIGTDGDYHGYELGKDDNTMWQWVMKEWRARCSTK